MSGALQEAARWTYDIDPTTGNSRASYPGEVIVAGNPVGGPVTGTGAQVLQNAPTINNPTIASGTFTGTISGGATYTSPTLTSPNITGTVAGGATYSGSPNLITPILQDGAGNATFGSNAAGIYLLSTTAAPRQFIFEVNAVNAGIIHSDANWGLLLQGLSGAAADIAFLSRSGTPQIRILSTGEVQIVGVTGATNAPAGDVGEYLSATRLVGTAVPITTSTITDILALSLTAGDWDVNANIVFQGAGGALQQNATCWLNTVSITQPTLPNSGGESIWVGTQPAANATMALPVGPMRINVAATTTVFLSCSTVFSGGTLSGYGFIGARRAR